MWINNTDYRNPKAKHPRYMSDIEGAIGIVGGGGLSISPPDSAVMASLSSIECQKVIEAVFETSLDLLLRFRTTAKNGDEQDMCCQAVITHLKTMGIKAHYNPVLCGIDDGWSAGWLTFIARHLVIDNETGTLKQERI